MAIIIHSEFRINEIFFILPNGQKLSLFEYRWKENVKNYIDKISTREFMWFTFCSFYP